MDTCHVFYFSGNPELVSMLCRFFGGLSAYLLSPAWFVLCARSVWQLMIGGTDCTGVIASDCITPTSRVATWICWVQPWRLAWARTVPSGIFILRAISRRPIPDTYATLICSQRSEEILLRGRFASGSWPLSDWLMFAWTFTLISRKTQSSKSRVNYVWVCKIVLAQKSPFVLRSDLNRCLPPIRPSGKSWPPAK
jgi:hypothetical protein